MSLVSDPINLIPFDTTEKVVAVYIWIGGSGMDLRSKARTLPGPASDLSELPKWNCDGSSTGYAPGEDSEVILYPQAIFRDPFRMGKNILVICDAYTPAGEPIPTNKRHAAAKIFSHPDVVAEEPWYGFHQEYTLLQKPVGGFPGPQGPYDCIAGDNKAFGHIADEHYKACLYAGINISGINGITMPGLSGPASGISAGDQLCAARYILERITENHGAVLSFDPNQIPGYFEGAGARTMYSTKSMREAGCYEVSKIKLDKLRMKHREDMAAYGDGNESGLPAKTVLQAFPYRDASIGARSGAKNVWKGYIIEDKRPASNMDPYVVTSKIAETTILWKPTAFEILVDKLAMTPLPRWMKKLWSYLLLIKSLSWQ